MQNEHGESGQALIELIIFLPLMFTLYGLISGFANAINGSINQQKITRSYFYYRVQNNSTIPKPSREDGGFTHTSAGWSQFGMFFIGWKERFESGENPVMPCYRVTAPLQAATGDNCETPYTSTSTQYIRVGTVYGTCGATYGVINNQVIPLPDQTAGDNFTLVLDPAACTIR